MSSGPLAAAATEVGLRIGQRVWPNLWKQTIDSLGPVLGLTRPDREFHPRDGRIVRLGIHRTDDPPLAFDVEVGIWWRAATLDSGSEVPRHPSERARRADRVRCGPGPRVVGAAAGGWDRRHRHLRERR